MGCIRSTNFEHFTICKLNRNHNISIKILPRKINMNPDIINYWYESIKKSPCNTIHISDPILYYSHRHFFTSHIQNSQFFQRLTFLVSSPLTLRWLFLCKKKVKRAWTSHKDDDNNSEYPNAHVYCGPPRKSPVKIYSSIPVDIRENSRVLRWLMPVPSNQLLLSPFFPWPPFYIRIFFRPEKRAVL